MANWLQPFNNLTIQQFDRVTIKGTNTSKLLYI